MSIQQSAAAEIFGVSRRGRPLSLKLFHSNEIEKPTHQTPNPKQPTHQISIETSSDNPCSISRGSKHATLIEKSSLILWYEAPMVHRHSLKLLTEHSEIYYQCIILQNMLFHLVASLLFLVGISDKCFLLWKEVPKMRSLVLPLKLLHSTTINNFSS